MKVSQHSRTNVVPIQPTRLPDEKFMMMAAAKMNDEGRLLQSTPSPTGGAANENAISAAARSIPTGDLPVPGAAAAALSLQQKSSNA